MAVPGTFFGSEGATRAKSRSFDLLVGWFPIGSPDRRCVIVGQQSGFGRFDQRILFARAKTPEVVVVHRPEHDAPQSVLQDVLGLRVAVDGHS